MVVFTSHEKDIFTIFIERYLIHALYVKSERYDRMYIKESQKAQAAFLRVSVSKYPLAERAKGNRNVKSCFYQDFFYLSDDFVKRCIKR